MKRQLWKRLEAVEKRDGYQRPVIFIPKSGESAAEADARYERWKAGDSMEGLPNYADIHGDPVVRIARIQFVDPPNQADGS